MNFQFHNKKENEYIRLPESVEIIKKVLAEINNEYVYDLKYELVVKLGGDLSIATENGIKIYSLILNNNCVHVDLIIEKLKNHPLEKVHMKRAVFNTRRNYYKFMKFLHSIKTLHTLIVSRVSVMDSDNEVYEPIYKSNIKNIYLYSYSEFIIERSTISSLNTLCIDSKVFDSCDVSLYMNEVKNLYIGVRIESEAALETSLRERLEKLLNVVRKVEKISLMTSYYMAGEVFYNFLSNNRNLKYAFVKNRGGIKHMLEYIPILGITLNELSMAPEHYDGTIENIVECGRVRKIRNIPINYTPSKYISTFLENDIGPLYVSSDVILQNFNGIEKIEKILFDEDIKDCYYEILKRPENNVKKVEIFLRSNSPHYEKILNSLKSKHCKVNTVNLSGWVTLKNISEILEVVYKKLITFKVNYILGGHSLQYDSCMNDISMKKIIHCLLNSNIEKLELVYGPYKISYEDLAKLIVKTKNIFIENIEFSDTDKTIDHTLEHIKNKITKNKEFYFTSRNLTISNLQYDHLVRCRKFSIEYLLKFDIIIKINSIKYYIKKYYENKEVIPKDDIVRELLKLPKDIIEDILNRI